MLKTLKYVDIKIASPQKSTSPVAIVSHIRHYHDYSVQFGYTRQSPRTICVDFSEVFLGYVYNVTTICVPTMSMREYSAV